MSKIKGHDNHSFYDDDATMKQIILDTACRVAAIEELLSETQFICDYPVRHNMGTVLVNQSSIESRANAIKQREPYASGYKALKNEGNPSESARSYMHTFTRNLIQP